MAARTTPTVAPTAKNVTSGPCLLKAVNASPESPAQLSKLSEKRCGIAGREPCGADELKCLGFVLSPVRFRFLRNMAAIIIVALIIMAKN